jgi:parvulin-like peptidyl-prolyl cis-trans isomerase-like protein
MRESARVALAAAWLVLGCSHRSPSAPGSSALPPGAVGQAGSELVSAKTVSRIEAGQGVTAREALGFALSDALFAHAARSNLTTAATRSLERAASARALLEQLLHEAELAGPPTSQELAEVLQDRWAELNRPDAVRTTHAVVVNDKAERDAAAHELAEELAAALAGTTSSEQLIRTAQDFPSQGFEIRAETLPFVTADGRVLIRRDTGFVADRGTFDVDFARAASAIAVPGELSGVVKSAFGYHVIRLDERALGMSVPESELPSLLGPEVLQRRAKRARRELLARLKAGAAVQVDRAADDLTARVKVAP